MTILGEDGGGQAGPTLMSELSVEGSVRTDPAFIVLVEEHEDTRRS